VSDSDPVPPDRRLRAVRALLVLTPFIALFAGGLAALQHADTREVYLLAFVMALFCLAAAGLVWLRGRKAATDAWWLGLILGLIGRK
jgi:uncharacterized membrane protein HdeD (DUF308 family)